MVALLDINAANKEDLVNSVSRYVQGKYNHPFDVDLRLGIVVWYS